MNAHAARGDGEERKRERGREEEWPRWSGRINTLSHETWRDARRESEHCQGVRIDAGTVNECPWAWAMAIRIKIINPIFWNRLKQNLSKSFLI